MTLGELVVSAVCLWLCQTPLLLSSCKSRSQSQPVCGHGCLWHPVCGARRSRASWLCRFMELRHGYQVTTNLLCNGTPKKVLRKGCLWEIKSCAASCHSVCVPAWGKGFWRLGFLPWQGLCGRIWTGADSLGNLLSLLVWLVQYILLWQVMWFQTLIILPLLQLAQGWGFLV